MTPEEKARVHIDQMLESAGWEVINRDEITAGMQAVAVREGLLQGNLEADYLLFIGNRAVGVLEAKRVEVDVLSPEVTAQALNYTHQLPDWCPAWHTPLPVVYVSNGKDTYLYDYFHLFPNEPEWQKANFIMSPKQVVDILRNQGIDIQGDFVRLPALRRRGLRDCQYDAIRSLETGFMAGKRRALIVLATGAGKTYTACLAAYRMLSYTPTRRVLFLVDRNNLGKQAEEGFGTFRLTENGDSFSNIYGVERMRSAEFGKDSNVIISTIQRLFSVLTGQQATDTDDNEENDNFDNDDDQTIITLNSLDLRLRPDTFDLIIVDECHRSIYSKWRQVLEYFSSARIIGLTATPSDQTLPFFDNNLVSRYSLEQSIADGVNVPCRVYSIDTAITTHGGTIHRGDRVNELTVYTGNEQVKLVDEDTSFEATEVNRNIIVPAQIDLIISTFHDCIYRDLYPQRAESDPDMRYIPKTLIYALNDQHATNIVNSVRRFFPGQDERFVQKITYSAGDSNQLIRSFRNDKEFRIAVTVTLVATGTDIKPLEIVLFMRDVASELLYVQMKGRGVRTIGDEQLRIVTPNADTKDLFYLVDAAGVTKHDHTIPRTPQTPQPPRLTLEQLLERIIMGNYTDELLDDLAGRLSRIHNRISEPKRAEFTAIAGISLHDLALRLYRLLGYEDIPCELPADITPQQLLLPLTGNSRAKEKLLELNRGYIHTLNPGEDQLISQGFSKEEARSATEAFEQYIADHHDEQEALRILYNHTGEPLTYDMLTELVAHLRQANIIFRINRLWNYYSLLDPASVRSFRTRSEREAITNIICLVRYALRQASTLQSFTATGSQLFNLWCGQMQRSLTPAQKALMGEVLDYIVHNGSCTFDSSYKEANRQLSLRLVREYQSAERAKDAILSLSSFILNNIA